MRIRYGYSITELLIAMLLGLLLLAIALTAFSSLSRSAKQAQQLAELQQTGQFMLSLMQNELQNIGFWGGKANVILAAETTKPDAPSPDCANDALDSGSFPSAELPFVTLYAKLVSSGGQLNCISSALKDSELLQVKRLIGQVQSLDMLKANRFYLETNWQHSRFISAASDGLQSAMDYYPYQHLVFYVQNQWREIEFVPVLMRKRLIRNASGHASMATDSIIDGVERLHFEFGIDTDADGSLDYQQATAHMTANQWQQHSSRIVSIKFYILLRALTQDKHYINNNIYKMGSHQFNANGDHYRRLLISSTVFFHNTQL
ncbi:PilW family protein [Rheinheimera sp. MMS21-TC3]|uniref:PilW family protein n=1 Tax=Rheinheimera sp. MMS21-TC3 TaxID=3072790 RepID=UPI0028C39421|nr:PilW family protein [Rheinheimera sp. MMS21-TC3]WNO60000.1 PilW family protein [Rheinheimera sp. MMS21-TC3]